MSWKMALPPDESHCKDATVLIIVYIVLQAHMYMNISHSS